MYAGDGAAIVGDSRDHGGPGLGARAGIGFGAIVAFWVKAQALGPAEIRNATMAQIRFGDCTQNRLGHGKQQSKYLCS